MPNDTQSASTPNTNIDNTTGSPKWLIFGVIGIVLFVVTVVIVILFLFRRKLFTKCMSGDSESTTDNKDQKEVEVHDKRKKKDDTVIEEEVVEMTVDAEVMDKSSSQYVNCDISTLRYVEDPTKQKINERRDPNQSYDYVVTKISDARGNQTYDYVDQATIKKLFSQNDTGYMNEESEVIDKTQTDKTQTFVHKTRKKKLHQNAPKVEKSDKPMKSKTEGAFETSKRPVGKGKTQRAERGANQYKKKDGVNPLKKKVDVARSTEMISQSDVYVDMNQTSCFHSQTETHSEKRKTSGPKQKNKLRSHEDKSPPNIQQNYENVDLKNTDAKEKGTERESIELDYVNISDISPTSSVSTDSNATDSSSSPDELHGNTIIYKAKKVNIIKMYSVNDEK
ncbi:unnamed protein product [Mytilus coruscus]|uniref:Uncharacterized protein n=1 Tax=Mytilus coruscus TaxID=42192 RepID=A0A6J8BTH7_MYTCO|nr:unnamed protein product [Mytilus coruscus]